MGMVSVVLKLINPSDKKNIFEGEFLVDSGAQYTVIPKNIWESLSLKPDRNQKFSLADGTVIERKIGSAFVEYQGIRSVTPVVLGEKHDSQLLGVITLEALGLVLNPFERKLYPAKLML